MGYLFAVGFISILGQVALLREISVAFYGVELIYTLSLGFWLFFGGCGALLGRKRLVPSPHALAILFLILALLLPLAIPFIRSLRPFLAAAPGAYLPLERQIGAVLAVLLPIGLIPGLQFQWAAKILTGRGRTLAAAYAVECLGGIAGGLMATALPSYGLQNFTVVLLAALCAAAASQASVGGLRARRLAAPAAGLSVLLLLLLGHAPTLDRRMTSWTHPDLVETRDSPYSRITIESRDGQTVLYENDALVFDSESTEAERFTHLAALEHPAPEKALVLGGGVTGLVHELLRHGLRTVDCVELNPALLEIVPPALSAPLAQSLRAASVRILLEDPRRFLLRSGSYDLILVGMPEPSSGQSNRFYTAEFFEQCRRRLRRDGLLAFRIPSSDTLWTPLLARRAASIYRAARSAFANVIVLPGTVSIYIASASPLTDDPDVLAARWRARSLDTDEVSPAYIRMLFTNDRYREIRETIAETPAPPNRDARPICYQYTLLLWISKFVPGAAFLDPALPDLRNGWGAAAAACLILPFLLARRAPRAARLAFLTATAAFIAMVCETLVILHYQTRSGILFQDIGLLLTAFMAGMTLGAGVIARWRRAQAKGIGALLLTALAALAGCLAGWFERSGGAGLWEAAAFLLPAGFLASAVLAHAAFRSSGARSDAVRPLYAADMIGGCLGAVLATLVLVPIAGLPLSAVLMIAPALLALLLL